MTGVRSEITSDVGSMVKLYIRLPIFWSPSVFKSLHRNSRTYEANGLTVSSSALPLLS